MAKKTTDQTTEKTAEQAATTTTTEQATAAIQTETAAATATVEPAAETVTTVAPEVHPATSETAAPEQAASEEVEVAKVAAEPTIEHAAPEPAHAEVEAEEPETVTLVDLVRDASERAQKEANHAAHAVLEDLLQAVHGIKAKIDAAVVHLEGEAAEVIAELRDLL